MSVHKPKSPEQRVPWQGLRSPKNVSLLFANDHSEDKHKAVSGLIGKTLIN